MRIRLYQSSDRDDCIAIFQSNVPLFFLPHEVAEFVRFLDALPCPYRAVERDSAIIACGGYHIHPQTGIAGLAWGMVRRDLHKRKIGRFLLQARLAEIAADPTATKVALNTSQHSRGFFEREGFALRAIVPDAYGPGLHRHDLEFVLDEPTRARLRALSQSIAGNAVAPK